MTEVEELLRCRRFRVIRQSRVGRDGQPHVWETIEHPGSVTIVPVLDDGSVALVENYRVAVGATLIELPAGTLEPGEDPADCAGRELEEETGFTARTVDPVGEFWMSPGILRERMHLYLARGLTAGPARPEGGEEINLLVVGWEEALRMIADGRIEDAKTIIGLLRWGQLRG